MISYPNASGYSGYGFASGNVHIGTDQVVVWVSSVIGSDVSGTGERNYPYATIATAISQLTAMGAAYRGSIVYVMAGHVETIADIDITYDVFIIGEGRTGGIPDVILTCSGTAVNYAFRSSTPFVELRNIKLIGPTTGTARSRLVANPDPIVLRVVDCVFEGGATDSADYFVDLSTGGDASAFVSINNVYRSAATVRGALPVGAIYNTVGGMSHIISIGDTFDDGAYGWSDPYAVAIDGMDAASQLVVMQGVSLLRGAQITEPACAYLIDVTTKTGAAKIGPRVSPP